MVDHRFQTEVAPVPQSNAVRLKVFGEIDAATFASFEQALQKLVSDGHKRIIVDLSQVSYLGSTGVGVLIATSEQAQGRGGAIVLMQPSEAVRCILEMLGVLPNFEIISNEYGLVHALSR